MRWSVTFSRPAQSPRSMAESPFKRFGLPPGPARGNPNRSRLLSHLAAMRDGRAAPATKLDFAGHLLSIPELDYYVILERFPDLKSPDTEIKRKAWIAFANSPLGAKYRDKRRQLRPKSPIIGLE